MQNNIKAGSSTLLQHHYELLKMEYEYEKQSYLDQTKKIGLRRKIASGKCWYPVNCGRSFYNSVNQLVIEVTRDESEIETNEFEPGRQVCFFRNTLGDEMIFMNFTATISFVDGSRMFVALPNEAAKSQILACSDLGVQLYFDETSYSTMFSALTKVMFAQNNRLAQLREVIAGCRIPTFKDFFPVTLPWLNASQEKAVRMVLAANDVAIVHGPPGTGKTTTMVEAVYETLRREEQVMVTAQSNAAVDWICEKLIDRGVNVLRIGNPVKVSDALLSSTYERRFESHPDYPELWALRKNLREVTTRLRKNKSEAERSKLHKIRSRINELEIRINLSIFTETRVVASTLVGAANRTISHLHVHTLFIDEAAQALEAACWIAIEKADRVVFAGDHCQLPPTIKCYEAQKGGLDVTMMQRLAALYPHAVSFLDMQYRMNTAIMQFSSEWFYNGALKASEDVAQRSLDSLDYPIVWYNTDDCDFKEESSEVTLSHLNKAEAVYLLELLHKYIEKNGPERVLEQHIDFGIISPYKSQVYYLRHLLKQNQFLRRYKKQITVNTVDGFQGQERDVILISMVRGNEEGKIGFLSDLRRMNVAITRARMKLIILGEAATLTHHSFYKKLYEYIEKVGNIYHLEIKE